MGAPLQNSGDDVAAAEEELDTVLRIVEEIKEELISEGTTA